jgi:16S rRNA (adenine1518-N6/adenine1519-N6)-dimethyltransferase
MASPFRPKKSLGQHFLADTNMIAKIISAINVEEGQNLMEIGPGTGALTRHLFQKFPQMVAVEVDIRAIEHLYGEMPFLKIIEQDILKVDWASFEQHLPAETRDSGDKWYVVGNLPYYITSPILFRFLEWRTKLSEAVIMMQKEVAERLVAKPRTKAYGILSVQFQVMCSMEYVLTVPPGVFIPPPKVESSVVRLSFDKAEPACGYEALKTVVRTAFSMRRKKLSNTLKPLLKGPLPDDISFSLDQRAEELTPEQFVELTLCLNQNDKV